MKALAFDTSTDACSVALLCDGRVVEDHRVERQAHARLLLAMIDGLLSDAGLGPEDLDAVVHGRGPGSFTGVRIAAAAAQGLAFAAGAGTLGISTLAAIAQGCLREHGDAHVCSVVDARMGELYVGRFRAVDGTMRPLETERVVPPDAAGIEALGASCAFAGSGIARFPSSFETVRMAGAPLRPDALPHATDLLALAAPILAIGALGDAGDAVPAYLRDRVARTEAERAAEADGAGG